ncbi:non-ribosomal peptide synthetase module [Saccharibacillus sp. JS10]|uniref:non-ribosomal peptide synthetase module n=1 Tax=Saccharibacillus sp. JS10 TaxID=2950552 RepID=UPI00210AE911|nr:non-ribosomal peptide synthetase module [Saccharibacillus sp. JS10]MCQ4088187.1 non-ribosomal peptide synthetase module [Saccharibacillus sp. JS10]
MVQRLATEFIKAHFVLPENQWSTLTRQLQNLQIKYRMGWLDNGMQAIVLEDGSGESIILSLRRHRHLLLCEFSFRLVDPQLTHLIRQLFIAFKGSGTVRRIYPGFTMLDFYTEGEVRRIIEFTPGSTRLVFEHRDGLPELQYRYALTHIEYEIACVRAQIDRLLDQRLNTREPEMIQQIDTLLQKEAFRLFVWEA